MEQLCDSNTIVSEIIDNIISDSIKKKSNIIICGNCGYSGHVYKKCKKPITSFGIIALKKESNTNENDTNNTNDINDTNNTKDTNGIKVLMVQRKDTMAFVEILRGRFPQNETNYGINNYVKRLLMEMTKEELELLRTKKFDELWEYLWVNKNSNCYKLDKNKSYEKYNTLDIKSMVDMIYPQYTETEWGIPKGRLNMTKYIKETRKDCALREFCEETGYKASEIKILPKYIISEEFMGTNKKKYKHVYYIGIMKSDIREPSEIQKSNVLQSGEIKKVKWFNCQEALNNIREYDIEKKRIINSIFTRIDLGLIKINF